MLSAIRGIDRGPPARFAGPWLRRDYLMIPGEIYAVARTCARRR